jgi:Protein of unknown function (DUF3179)
MPVPTPGFLKSRAARGAILAVLAVEAVVVAVIYHSERSYLKEVAKSVRSGDASKLRRIWRKVEGPGISRPPTRRAADAKLADDEEVIGIVVDGKARAYRVRAFDQLERHIVNDLIGDRPVTVAYCNVSDCARAYAGERGDRLLDVSQGGLQGVEMILKVSETYYWHRTAEPVETGGGPPFPYATYPLARRTWGDWRREHPDTDLYLGRERRVAP